MTALWALASSPVAAQEAGAENKGGMEEIIVTGAATAGGLKKLDTAFSVTSLSEEKLKEANLTASADVLKQSPGVFIESSGGPGGGSNVEVAGFPSASAAPYVTSQLNGVSIFPMSGQTYIDGPNLLRPDESIRRVELVQGGPGVLYGNGQPGLTANYILKRGTDKTEGDIGLTYGFEGYERVDGFVGGALNKDAGLYASVGGFWNKGYGIRNPEFVADNGGQVTGTLAKDWDDGTLMVYARYMSLQDPVATDTPILYNASQGTFSPYPGFDPRTGSVGSKADQYVKIQISPCSGAGCTPGTLTANAANGRAPEYYVVGGNFNWDFGHGLQLLDNLAYSNGTMLLSEYYNTSLVPQSLATYILSAETSKKISTALKINASYTNNGASAPLTQNIFTQEMRYAYEKFRSLSNEVHLSKELFPGNTLTVGNVTAIYGASLTQYAGNTMLLTAQSNPTPIAVNLTDGTNTWQLTSPGGLASATTAATGYTAKGYNTAFFVSDSWKVDNWLLDGGLRTERQIFNEGVWNTASGSLSGNPYQLFNSSASYFVPGERNIPYTKTASSWTVGLNYEIDPSMSAYARVNEGVHFPAFGDLTSLPASFTSVPLQRAHNYEIGYKYQSDFIATDLSLFYRTFANVLLSSPVTINGVTENGSLAYGSTTKGLEYAITLKPFSGIDTWNGFTLSAAGNYGYGSYNHGDGCVNYSGVFNQTVCTAANNINGYLLQRQPIFQTRITPAFTLPTEWGALRTWFTAEYVGQHYGDQQQLQNLESYYDFSFGITGDIGDHWEVNLLGSNVTNEIGLTEGNARATLGTVASGSVINARSIDGREISLQVKYRL